MRCDEPGCTNRGTFVLSGVRDDTGTHDHRLCEEHAPKDARGSVVQLDKNGRPARDRMGRIVFRARAAQRADADANVVSAADVDDACRRLDASIGDLLR